MSLSPLQLVFDGLSDELSAPVRAEQRVDALKHRLRKPNGRADDAKRRAPHALGTNRHRFFGQGLHYFRYRLLTSNRYRFYITAIGYGDKQMNAAKQIEWVRNTKTGKQAMVRERYARRSDGKLMIEVDTGLRIAHWLASSTEEA